MSDDWLPTPYRLHIGLVQEGKHQGKMLAILVSHYEGEPDVVLDLETVDDEEAAKAWCTKALKERRWLSA